MRTATWAPDYTARAQDIWHTYQNTHDLTAQRGKTAAIDPEAGRVWIGESAVDIAEQMAAEGVSAPVYLVRVGFDHFVQKGRR